jgi:hypothetical protein
MNWLFVPSPTTTALGPLLGGCVLLGCQARLKLGRYILSSPIPPPPTAKKGAAGDVDSGLNTQGVLEGRRGHYIALGMEQVTLAACCSNVDPLYKVGVPLWQTHHTHRVRAAHTQHTHTHNTHMHTHVS